MDHRVVTNGVTYKVQRRDFVPENMETFWVDTGFETTDKEFAIKERDTRDLKWVVVE